MGLSTADYTVADTGRTNSRGEAIFALFRNGVELVEGVEQLQVQYGERVGTNNANVRFVDADATGLDMSKVVSMRVGLLVAATQATAGQDDNQTYTLAGTAVGPVGGSTTVTHAVDQRIRRAFNTTLSLRNRR
jgi:type IV pilus assembly protein PilW